MKQTQNKMSSSRWKSVPGIVNGVRAMYGRYRSGWKGEWNGWLDEGGSSGLQSAQSSLKIMRLMMMMMMMILMIMMISTWAKAWWEGGHGLEIQGNNPGNDNSLIIL